MSGALLRSAIAVFLSAAANAPGALPAALGWRAPQGCPERAQLAREIARLAGGRVPYLEGIPP